MIFFTIFKLFGFFCLDPRVKQWFLMQSAWPTIYISAAYMILAKWVGPWLMKNRRPYYPKNAILCYNVFQIVFSFWMFYEVNRSQCNNFVKLLTICPNIYVLLVSVLCYSHLDCNTWVVWKIQVFLRAN